MDDFVRLFDSSFSICCFLRAILSTRLIHCFFFSKIRQKTSHFRILFLALLAKLVGFVVWIITFIDFYSTTPAGVRYFLCLFPNLGLLSCMSILQQFERRSGGVATFQHLYTNMFDYPLYIGICLLLMLIYSVIYFFLAIYVERLNPGEFGVSQRWNYIFKKSYWTSTKIQPSDLDLRSDKDPNGMANTNHWIELNNVGRKRTPAMTIDHLNKVSEYAHSIEITFELIRYLEIRQISSCNQS